MTTGFVERITMKMAYSDIDRRGFMQRFTMGAAALLMAPKVFALEPVSAYAAICSCSGQSCNCGSLCCDGYTEFCCTMYGANTCPSGTVPAGWWKADGAGVCDDETGAKPRYYLDCNIDDCGTCGCGSRGVCSGGCQTDSDYSCGCGDDNCNNRKSSCTQFRYGQCNADISCLGPIVCRVVTCTPPWIWDNSCTTASATDNNTRFHNRPCLTEPIPYDGRFLDDDGSEFEADIEWLAAQGITIGCNPPTNDRFCPNDVVTRGEMAAFLHRALPDLPEVRPAIDFTDDDDSVFLADIEWLYSRGVTQGTSVSTFSPTRAVTRAQMAAFMTRALRLVDDGGGDLFIDDDDSIFEADIDRLAAAGITVGCNPPTSDRFCPDDNVTRGQMAAFLHRALT